ncbi:hypothetical protein K8B33_10625 [Alcanivorax sp. JB21]|uniref:hypothetical protein n=1 Tax=Alcanivorax limicola TaxID=2874102 RepID=UPI001CBC5B0F|nr:hypothetical protein [Alcanivorax limicola]MBZ2189552.1 hypothetical protein [Alcanivorax limicola]
MTLFQALRWLDELEYVIEALAQQADAEARATLVELILEAESDAHLDVNERTMLLNTLERARMALMEMPANTMDDTTEPMPASILSGLTRRLWQQVH